MRTPARDMAAEGGDQSQTAGGKSDYDRQAMAKGQPRQSRRVSEAAVNAME